MCQILAINDWPHVALIIAAFFQKNGDGNKLELKLIEEGVETVIWTLDDFYVDDKEERWYAAQVGVSPPNPDTNYQVPMKNMHFVEQALLLSSSVQFCGLDWKFS